MTGFRGEGTRSERVLLKGFVSGLAACLHGFLSVIDRRGFE